MPRRQIVRSRNPVDMFSRPLGPVDIPSGRTAFSGRAWDRKMKDWMKTGPSLVPAADSRGQRPNARCIA
eukprot:3830276-Pleurochrysis_carterae.AAC.3